MEETDPEIASPQIKSTSFGKWDSLMLAGIILSAALLIALQRFMEPEMGRDSSYYLILAEYWRDGGFQCVLDQIGNFWFPPLHLFLIAILSRTGLSPESAAMVVSMGCGILMPLVSFAIAHEIFRDKRISLTAALLTALNPSIIEMSVQAQRDIPYLFAAGWCIFLIIAAIRRGKWYWWCAAGILFAAAMLIRFETVEFLPLLGIYFIVVLCKKQQKWYLLCRDMAIFAASGIAAIILLLASTGTLSYMAGSYYRYFTAQAQAIQKLYHGGEQ